MVNISKSDIPLKGSKEVPQNSPNPPQQKTARNKQATKQTLHILAKARSLWKEMVSQELWIIGKCKFFFFSICSFETISWFLRVSKGDGRHPAGVFCLRWGETQEALAVIH